MNKMEDSVQRAARDLINSRYAIALTGAGISTESGVPDFRGPSGIWTNDPDAEKRAYQTYDKFILDPKEYWEQRINSPSLLGDLEVLSPNPGHYAIAELEKMGFLKCVITQNIDNFHSRAGSKNVLEYHGNAFKLRCSSCNARYGYKEYDLNKLKETGELPPHCKKCGGLLKEDVVHFQEPIPSDVAQQSLVEAGRCDLMLICGTSAVVYPFAQLPRLARNKDIETQSIFEAGLSKVEKAPAVTIIEINAEQTQLTFEKISDYFIQGKTGEVLPKIVKEIKKLK
jgi:NAD-dependent deacetylase